MKYEQALEETAQISLTIFCQIEDFNNGCKELLDVFPKHGEVAAHYSWQHHAKHTIEKLGWIFRENKNDDFAAQQYVCPVCLANEKD